ncbi:hypothetical protein LINPERPRIM_LOCUS11830 [Linum perenne]
MINVMCMYRCVLAMVIDRVDSNPVQFRFGGRFRVCKFDYKWCHCSCRERVLSESYILFTNTSSQMNGS